MSSEPYREEMHRRGGRQYQIYQKWHLLRSSLKDTSYLHNLELLHTRTMTAERFFLLFFFPPCNQVVLAFLYRLSVSGSFHTDYNIHKQWREHFTKKHQKQRLDERGRSILPTTFLLKSRLDLKLIVSTP